MAKGKTIVIADDDAEILALLAKNFKALGFRVLQADNGTQAFKWVQAENPDVVITDMKMPGGDGKSLLNRIASDYAHTPVIIITGFTELTRDRAVALGARELFYKPFKIVELNKLVEHLVKKTA